MHDMSVFLFVQVARRKNESNTLKTGIPQDIGQLNPGSFMKVRLPPPK